jgi:hypothetical protein
MKRSRQIGGLHLALSGSSMRGERIYYPTSNDDTVKQLRQRIKQAGFM